MSSWAEGVLALVVLLGFGLALVLFSGESIGGGATATTQPVAIDPEAAARGGALAQSTGCLQCHTVDGTPGSGPTFRGLAGSSRPLASGETVIADDIYLFNSIVDPSAQIGAGFEAIMPPDYGDALTEAEVEDLVEYIESLGE